VSYYQRRLPHRHPEDAALVITWRLHVSLPRHSESPANPAQTAGQRSVAQDRQMDRAPTGPLWLKDPKIAAAVKETLLAAGG